MTLENYTEKELDAMSSSQKNKLIDEIWWGRAFYTVVCIVSYLYYSIFGVDEQQP